MFIITIKFKSRINTGLPHTQGTQGIQRNSGNFQVEENLRKTQGSFKIKKISKIFFGIFRMRFY